MRVEKVFIIYLVKATEFSSIREMNNEWNEPQLPINLLKWEPFNNFINANFNWKLLKNQKYNFKHFWFLAIILGTKNIALYLFPSVLTLINIASYFKILSRHIKVLEHLYDILTNYIPPKKKHNEFLTPPLPYLRFNLNQKFNQK
jgi:hypothetical protein